MILFASDLDRTLIYSEKFIDINEQFRWVEKKDTQIISYMLNSSIEKLKILTDKLLFVPVTTRTIEQYRRITVFKNEIKPKYAIVCNGGNIFVDGKLDEDWSILVKSKLNNECLTMNEVVQEFNKVKSDLNIEMIREVDDLFFYSKYSEKLSEESTLELTTWLEKNNWKMVFSGMKIYFLPKHINKSDAVQYVAEREEINNIITSGDSLLDYDMAGISTLFISPQHGDIYNHSKLDQSIVKFTKESGMLASYEILEFVLNELNQLN